MSTIKVHEARRRLPQLPPLPPEAASARRWTGSRRGFTGAGSWVGWILSCAGALLEAGAERGALEILGSAARDGAIQIALAADGPRSRERRTLVPATTPSGRSQDRCGYVGSRSPAPGEPRSGWISWSPTCAPCPGLRHGRAAADRDRRINLAGFLMFRPTE